MKYPSLEKVKPSEFDYWTGGNAVIAANIAKVCRNQHKIYGLLISLSERLPKKGCEKKEG